MTRARVAAGIAGVLILAALAACTGAPPPAGAPVTLSLSTSDVAPYAGAHAELDPAKGFIVEPLDAYAMSFADTRLIESANDVLIDRCMRKAGYANVLTRLDRSREHQAENRRFGIWSPQLAAAYGYGLPPRSDEGDDLLAAQSAAWGEVWKNCYRTTETLPALRYDSADAFAQDSVIAVGERGYNEADRYASEAPDWTRARHDWWSCLEKEGLTPRKGVEEWSPVVPSDPEAAIRTATIDVACKQQVDFIPRMTDLETSYQAAYIAKHEAALETQRAAVRKVVQHAKAILRSAVSVVPLG